MDEQKNLMNILDEIGNSSLGFKTSRPGIFVCIEFWLSPGILKNIFFTATKLNIMHFYHIKRRGGGD